jgi:hypothetical protein
MDVARFRYRRRHKVLTRPTYIGRHRFNTNLWKMRERNPGAAVVEMAVPPIVDPAEFEAVQMLLIRTRMLQNCASAPPMQTPDSSSCTMRSRKASPTSPSDARGPCRRAQGHPRSGPR